MLVVLDKPRFQRMLAITRDDRRPKQQGRDAPFLRLEASDGRMTITGREVSAEFPATVYEPGVLFLRVTKFRQLLQSFTLDEIGGRFVTLQVNEDGLRIETVRLDFIVGDMLLYPDPATAPARHPDERVDTSSDSADTNDAPDEAAGTLFEGMQ